MVVDKQVLQQHNQENEYIGKPHLEETKRKISKSLKGRHLSEEHKKKMSEILIGNTRRKGKKASDITKRNVSIGIRRAMKEGRGGFYRIGHKPWSTGLTKENSEKISIISQKASVRMKQRYDNGWESPVMKLDVRGTLNPFFGRHHTQETKDLIVKTKRENGTLRGAPIGHKPYYPKLRFVPDLNHSVRSSWEEQVCNFLHTINVIYEYEKTTLYAISNGKRYSWLPDLTLCENVFLEIKGYLTRERLLSYIKILEQNDCFAIFVIGDRRKVLDISTDRICYVPYDSFIEELPVVLKFLKISDVKC